MPVRGPHKSTEANANHCRIARFLGVGRIDVLTHPDAERMSGREACGDGTARCCELGECPNAKLMFELMFDGMDPPVRARMH